MTSSRLLDLAHTLAPHDMRTLDLRVMCTTETPVDLHPLVRGAFVSDLRAIQPDAPAGVCAVIINTKLTRDDSEQLAVLVHELAHAVEAGYYPIPDGVPASKVAAEFTEELRLFISNKRAPRIPPWVAERHIPEWLRCVCHLAYRAERFGWSVDVDAAAGLLPAFSSARLYLAALGDEPQQCVEDSFAEILSRPMPDEFQALWSGDVAPWYEANVRHETA